MFLLHWRHGWMISLKLQDGLLLMWRRWYILAAASNHHASLSTFCWVWLLSTSLSLPYSLYSFSLTSSCFLPSVCLLSHCHLPKQRRCTSGYMAQTLGGVFFCFGADYIPFFDRRRTSSFKRATSQWAVEVAINAIIKAITIKKNVTQEESLLHVSPGFPAQNFQSCWALSQVDRTVLNRILSW